MLFKAILLSILCAPGLLLGQEAHYGSFGGVNNFADSMMIADGDAQDASNVLTDEGDLRTIYGNSLYAVIGSSPIAFFKEWINPSIQRILFVQAGYSLYATDPSSGTLVTVKHFGSDRDLDMVAAFGRAYFSDGTVDPFYSVGGASTPAAGMDSCKYVELYQTRLVCVNTSTDTSKVYLSAYNAPTDWAVSTSKDSAAIKYYSKDDGEGINCVFTTPSGIFIGKNSSVGMLKGSDNETFYWKDISKDVGCSDDRTVQLVDGELVWLARDGYYSYDFNSAPKPISIKINNSTKLIKRAASTDSQWTVASQAGWEVGTGDGWEYAVTPGSIKAKTYSKAVYELTPFGFNPGNTNLQLNYAQMEDATSGVMIASTSWSTRLEGRIIDFGVRPDQMVKLRFLQSAGDTGPYVLSNAYHGTLGGVVTITYTSNLYTILTGAAFVAYTTITSSGYDSGITTPEYQVITSSGTGVTIRLYTSSDNNTWSGPLTPPLAAADKKRYWKYGVVFGATAPDYYYSTITAFSSSTYTSDVHFLASDMAAWKLFSASQSGNATPSYSVRAASFAFASDDVSPSFVTQPNNATIAASTGTYAQFKITSNIAASTDTLTINSIAIAYTVGQAAPRAASVSLDHRYIASVSHSSTTANDITYIWQKNKEWTFSDQGYASLGIFNGKLMGGSASTSSKLWYILDPLAYSFDGTAINAYWTTKDFAFTRLNNHKVIRRLWITAENNGLGNFGVAWQANRDGVWNSTTTTLNASGFTIKEVEGLFEDQYPGRQFRFKFSGNEIGRYFRMKLFSLYYDLKDLIKD